MPPGWFLPRAVRQTLSQASVLPSVVYTPAVVVLGCGCIILISVSVCM